MSTKKELRHVTHVVFDVDGLLVDTEVLYSKIMQEVLNPYGHKFTWEIKTKQMGKKETESAKVLIDEFNLPLTVEEYREKCHHLQEEMFPHADLLPGVDRLVRHLHKHNIPIALATGGDGRGYKLKTAGHKELFALFSHIVLSTDDPEVKHGKPAPDCFLLAAKRFSDSPSPDKVLVFEDAPNGVEAALAAGMQCVWIPDPNVDKTILQRKATLTLNSMEQFKPELFGLPPYGE